MNMYIQSGDSVVVPVVVDCERSENHAHQPNTHCRDDEEHDQEETVVMRMSSGCTIMMTTFQNRTVEMDHNNNSNNNCNYENGNCIDHDINQSDYKDNHNHPTATTPSTTTTTSNATKPSNEQLLG